MQRIVDGNFEIYTFFLLYTRKESLKKNKKWGGLMHTEYTFALYAEELGETCYQYDDYWNVLLNSLEVAKDRMRTDVKKF